MSFRRRMCWWLCCTLVGVLCPSVPGAARLYTACAQVTDIAVAVDGAIWAATKGGVLCWKPGETTARQWTTANGLAGNEWRGVAPAADGMLAIGAQALGRIAPSGIVTDEGRAWKDQELRCLLAMPEGCWVGSNKGAYLRTPTGITKHFGGDVRRFARGGAGGWAVTSDSLIRLGDGQHWPLPDVTGNVTALVATADTVYYATAFGLWTFTQEAWRELPLPAGGGSHVSALVLRDGQLTAALYGDGLYTLWGQRWVREATPAQLQRVTALVARPDGLVAGTWGDGVWAWRGTRWIPCALPPSLPSADIYAIAAYHDAMWISTFDQGLLRLQGGTWQRYTTANGLSTNAPRDLLVYHGALYIRHTTGEVDRLDAAGCRRVFGKRELPREEVYAMATDGDRLYLGTWAGWAVTDGTRWEYHFHETALRKQVVTAIAAGGGTTWIGTQQAGLFAYRDGVLTVYHEAHGLTDDWVTRIAIGGGRVLIGTYTGGLLAATAKRLTPVLHTQGFAVRSIVFLTDGRPVIATPLGVYREEGGAWHLLDPAQYGGLESQALCAVPAGLWVGSRTALSLLPAR